MNLTKTISVIVPVYKVEGYLDRCVESIVQQSYDNLEIILIDDGSPDACPKKCDEWGRKDGRIRVIHQENKGLSGARNKGIALATGEWILFVDSDDYLETDACEKLLASSDDVDMVIGEANVINNRKDFSRLRKHIEEHRVYSGEEFAQNAIKHGEWYAEAWSCLYRKAFLKENHLIFQEGIYHEDVAFEPRLYLAAERVRYIRYPFYNYVIRGDSITGQKSAKHVEDSMMICSSWAALNQTIADKKTQKAYAGALASFFMATCRTYQLAEGEYPDGMNAGYLIKNAASFKDFLKAVLFVINRRLYVKL